MASGKFDDPISIYVRARVQAHFDAGGQLKDFVDRSGHPALPKSAPSQVKDGKLGVGSRTVKRWAKALGFADVFELTAAAHKFVASQATVIALPTWEGLIKNATTQAQARALEAARALDMGLTTVALAIDIAARLPQSNSWPAKTWSEFFSMLDRFDEAPPAESTKVAPVSEKAPQKAVVGRRRGRK